MGWFTGVPILLLGKVGWLAGVVLRGEPVPVPGEGPGVADVGEAQKLLGEALGPDGEAPVGGHAVLEDLQLPLEGLGVHALGL